MSEQPITDREKYLLEKCEGLTNRVAKLKQEVCIVTEDCERLRMAYGDALKRIDELERELARFHRASAYAMPLPPKEHK
jgi:hypothetical protein